DAAAFLQARPETALPLAKLLARRLHAATTYLVNLKQQFQDYENHFGMVDEVLESLTHQQDEDFAAADELPPDPRL
ncbi:MAG: cyclic nucleotide-binding domain-containing protein, partial [Pseudomonadota bacterium]